MYIIQCILYNVYDVHGTIYIIYVKTSSKVIILNGIVNNYGYATRLCQLMILVFIDYLKILQYVLMISQVLFCRKRKPKKSI